MKKKKLHLIDLPEMRCDKHCGACCGVVPINSVERQQLKSYVAEHNLHPLWQGSTCPFYQKGTCAVYPVRPLACRAYGHSWRMDCPRGYNENIEERRLAAWLLRQEPPVTTVHRAFGVPVPTDTAERSVEAAHKLWSSRTKL
jgi:hypothetical protein